MFMKFKAKNIISFILILCMSLSIMACDSYKYNYIGEKFKVQYDEELLKITPSDKSQYEDIFIHPIDGYYIAYVDVTVIDDYNRDPIVILNNIQKYFLSIREGSKVVEENATTSTGRYKRSTTNIVEYDYTIATDVGNQIVRSRVETIGENHFVVIYRRFEGIYSKDTINALDLAYESAVLDLD